MQHQSFLSCPILIHFLLLLLLSLLHKLHVNQYQSMFYNIYKCVYLIKLFYYIKLIFCCRNPLPPKYEGFFAFMDYDSNSSHSLYNVGATLIVDDEYPESDRCIFLLTCLLSIII